MAAQRGRAPVVGVAGDVDLAPAGGLPGAGRAAGERSACRLRYVDALADCGLVAVVLPPVVAHMGAMLALVDAVVLVGGDDPQTEPFGEPTHAAATPVRPRRQAFDAALLRALAERPAMPVLGVCYGMQMMALVAGGRLDQHLPDTLGPAGAAAHWAADHAIEPAPGAPAWLTAAERPHSRHRQAIADAGGLAVVGRAPDGVIEAVADPGRAFYAGVQWHPELSGPGALGLGVYRALARACGVGE